MAKKTFIDDIKEAETPQPQLAFLSTSPLEGVKNKKQIEQQLKAERERKAAKQIKDKRLNILITNEMHKDILDLCRFEGISLNGLFNKAVAEYIGKNKDKIDKIRGLNVR